MKAVTRRVVLVVVTGAIVVGIGTILLARADEGPPRSENQIHNPLEDAPDMADYVECFPGDTDLVLNDVRDLFLVQGRLPNPAAAPTSPEDAVQEYVANSPGLRRLPAADFHRDVDDPSIKDGTVEMVFDARGRQEAELLAERIEGAWFITYASICETFIDRIRH